MSVGPGIAQLVSAIRAGRTTAQAVARQALQAMDERGPEVNAFTTALPAERVLAQAARTDARLAAGDDPGPLAGVPFAAKDLFDIEGVVTLAGSRILADRAPAVRSAWAVRALEDAGATLMGGLNMEELAYGFLTDNAHYGRTRNPHDTARTAGGSSGGSGAAVAAGMVPLALGTDTTGSIRIPAAFCGTVGFKPTYGRIATDGMVPMSPSLDHVGWIGGCVDDVALAWQVLSGEAPPAAAAPPARIARADDYFDRLLSPEARAGLERAARALGPCDTVRIPEAAAARGAAYAIISAEAASLRLDDLRARPLDFDPATRDRFLAGALLPVEWYVRAQCFRAWHREQVARLFERVDVLLLPAAPFAAPRWGEEDIAIEGAMHPVRSTIGRFTQPIAPLGLPIVCVPVAPPGALPIGVQLVGRPGGEWSLIDTARRLERALAAGNTSTLRSAALAA
jgi:AtzE family amidohydrolase